MLTGSLNELKESDKVLLIQSNVKLKIVQNGDSLKKKNVITSDRYDSHSIFGIFKHHIKYISFLSLQSC